MPTVKNMTKRKVPHQWLLKLQPTAIETFSKLSWDDKRGVFRRLRELLTADDPYTLPYVKCSKRNRLSECGVFALVTTAYFSQSKPLKLSI